MVRLPATRARPRDEAHHDNRYLLQHVGGNFIIYPVPNGTRLTPNKFMKRYSSIIALTFGLALMGAGCGLTETKQSLIQKNTNQVVTNVSIKGTISNDIVYSGQDGKNALELLQAKFKVESSAQGFVTSIDGRKAVDHEFWAFYVNGKQAEVGAKDLMSKNSDTITWKIEKF